MPIIYLLSPGNTQQPGHIMQGQEDIALEPQHFFPPNHHHFPDFHYLVSPSLKSSGTSTNSFTQEHMFPNEFWLILQQTRKEDPHHHHNPS